MAILTNYGPANVRYFGQRHGNSPYSLLETYDAVVGLLRAIFKKCVAKETKVTDFRAENYRYPLGRGTAWPVMGAKIP